MPYRPYAPTETDRSYAYKYVWASAACSVTLLPLYLVGFDGIIYGWIMGGAAGGLLASTITGRTDDYFRSLVAVGHRWAIFALFAYMILGWFACVVDLAVPPGFGILAGEVREEHSGGATLLFDGHLAAIMLAIIYHAGYGYQWLRDRVGTEDEA
ncbi:MAG: hypothetical protein ACJLS3_04600 [Erythrobacter sp.]